VGGTKVAAGLVNTQGAILSSLRKPMVSTEDAAAGFHSVTSAIDALFSENPGVRENIGGIGVCAPGPLDPRTGVVINPPNLKCWRNFPLGDELSHRYNVPVKVDNDGNAAALAENLWGAGRGYSCHALRSVGVTVAIVHDYRDVLFGGHAPEPDDHLLGDAKAKMKEIGAALAIATDPWTATYPSRAAGSGCSAAGSRGATGATPSPGGSAWVCLGCLGALVAAIRLRRIA